MTDQQTKPNELLIYSSLAKRLVSGRKGNKTTRQYPIYGLLQFAGKVSIIWSDAKQGNPYALWYLVRMDRLLESNQEALTRYQQKLDSLANDDTGLTYQPVLGEAQSFDMHFSTPYPWIAMRQIKQLDTLVLLGQTLNRVGLLPTAQFQIATLNIRRLITSGFNQTMEYRSFELTWEDLQSTSATAHQASQAMGMIPLNLFNGELQPAFNPQGPK